MRNSNTMPHSRLPNLLIAGVVKGGTTSLFSYLSFHPDICSSSVKETCYFSTYRYGQLDYRYRQSADPFKQYKEYFSHCQKQKYVMEATPGYFEGGLSVAQKIKDQLGEDIKVIVILREPIDRLISFFNFKKSMMEIDKDLSLEEYLSSCHSIPIHERKKQENNIYWGINGGFYSDYLDDWITAFGSSLKIVFFDDLKSDPKLLSQNICSWLDIEGSVYDSYEFGVENKTVTYKSKRIQELALRFNMGLEKFWRSNPRLKKAIRDLYYAVNGDKKKIEISKKSLNYLQSLYRPYNKKLALILLKSGCKCSPSWVHNSET